MFYSKKNVTSYDTIIKTVKTTISIVNYYPVKSGEALKRKMITVTAAIMEKGGLILAARRKAGKHMAGFWEFPGGKVEENETPTECLKRELFEEFGIECTIGDFFDESIHAYNEKTIRLLGYFVTHNDGEFRCTDHDRIVWLKPSALESLQWAPADIPLMKNLVKLKNKQ